MRFPWQRKNPKQIKLKISDDMIDKLNDQVLIALMMPYIQTYLTEYREDGEVPVRFIVTKEQKEKLVTRLFGMLIETDESDEHDRS